MEDLIIEYDKNKTKILKYIMYKKRTEKEIIQKFLHKEFTLIMDKEDPITEKRTKMSYYELQDVAERMMKKAVLNNTTKIKMSDVYLDIARQINAKIALNVIDSDD